MSIIVGAVPLPPLFCKCTFCDERRGFRCSGSRGWGLLTLCFILNHVLPEALNEFVFLPVHKL